MLPLDGVLAQAEVAQMLSDEFLLRIRAFLAWGFSCNPNS